MVATWRVAYPDINGERKNGLYENDIHVVRWEEKAVSPIAPHLTLVQHFPCTCDWLHSRSRDWTLISRSRPIIYLLSLTFIWVKFKAANSKVMRRDAETSKYYASHLWFCCLKQFAIFNSNNWRSMKDLRHIHTVHRQEMLHHLRLQAASLKMCLEQWQFKQK